MKNTFVLEDVAFQSLTEIVPQIGGFASSLMAVFFIVFGYFINKQWVESIRNEIINLKENEGCKLEICKDNLMNRVSFRGVYQLHDQVDTIKVGEEAIQEIVEQQGK